jgi:Metallo-peptidase family M12
MQTGRFDMRSILIALLLLSSFSASAQETTIRVLGAYVTGLSLSTSQMTAQLQGIVSSWNSSGLPATSVTTVQLLNGAVAVPVNYPGLPSTMEATAEAAYQQPALTSVRQQWQADVIILFRSPAAGKCGAASTFWYNGNFVPLTNGLDLRYRNTAYIGVVNPGCFTPATAHEFGHLLGGGHATDTSSRLYDDARAFVRTSTDCNINRTPVCMTIYTGTALADYLDVPAGSSFSTTLQYSRIATGYGDAGHNNVRTLAVTARSVANFYPYPTNPVAILRPPVNVLGINYGCASNGTTRNYIFWQNDPATNVVVDRYEMWFSQPVTTFYQYGWTVFTPGTDSYVWGATARARPNACSGPTCSALSAEFYDAVPQNCGGTGGGVSPGT